MLVDKLYHDGNFTVDARFTDTRSLLEQVISLLYADKTVEATRLFLKIFVATVNFDMHVNALTKIWELALRKNFMPTVEMLELAVQNSMLSVRTFTGSQLKCTARMFKRAAKNAHAVDRKFKNYYVGCLVNSLNMHTQAGNVAAAATCKKLLDEINSAGN